MHGSDKETAAVEIAFFFPRHERLMAVDDLYRRMNFFLPPVLMELHVVNLLDFRCLKALTDWFVPAG